MTDKKEKIGVSDKMMGLLYLDKSLYLGLAGLIVGLSCLLGGIFLYASMKSAYERQLEHPGYFDPFKESGYSAISAQLATDYFAEHVKEGYRLYFGFDSTFEPFIFCADGEATEELQALIDATIEGDGDELPPMLRLSGFCRPLTPEIMGYARDAYSQMWSDETIPISSDELYAMVGDYYLDTRPSSFLVEHSWAMGFFLVPGAILVIGLGFLFQYRKWIKAQLARMERYREWLPAADRELEQTERFSKRLPLYLTEHFLITAAYSLDVIPYEAIQLFSESGSLLLVTTRDGETHIVADRLRCDGCYDRLLIELHHRQEMAARGLL